MVKKKKNKQTHVVGKTHIKNTKIHMQLFDSFDYRYIC